MSIDGRKFIHIGHQAKQKSVHNHSIFGLKNLVAINQMLKNWANYWVEPMLRVWRSTEISSKNNLPELFFRFAERHNKIQQLDVGLADDQN